MAGVIESSVRELKKTIVAKTGKCGDARISLGRRRADQTVTLLERETLYATFLEPSRVRLGNDNSQEQRPLTNVTLVVAGRRASRHAIVNWQVTLVLLLEETLAALPGPA